MHTKTEMMLASVTSLVDKKEVFYRDCDAEMYDRNHAADE